MKSTPGSRWMLGLAVIACGCGVDLGEANRASARGADEGTPGADALRALPPDTGCVPACTDKQCGPDGCGGSCGTCPPYDSCSAAGLCFCNPDCNGLQCGPDGCGGSCGTCPTGNTCDPNTGQCTTCQPSCQNKQCGPDGCGSSCGTCWPGHICDQGQCTCLPNCQNKQCGPDGCGGSCGTCPAGFSCDANTGQCGLCQNGQTLCAANDVTSLAVCKNGSWETQRCPDWTLCADNACRQACDGMLVGHNRSAFCISPHPDSRVIYMTTNDPNHWIANNTLQLRVDKDNQNPAPILLDRSLGWPGIFRLNCPQGTATLWYALGRFGAWFAPRQLTFTLGFKHAGQKAVKGIWTVDFRNVNSFLAISQLAVPLTYQSYSMTIEYPLTAQLDRTGNFNIVYLTLASNLLLLPCDPVDLNWLYLEVQY